MQSHPPIHTKFHEIRRLIHEKKVFVEVRTPNEEPGGLGHHLNLAEFDDVGTFKSWAHSKHDLLILCDMMAEAPKFVMSDDLMNKFSDEELEGQLRALHGADLLRMPHETCLVEAITPYSGIRNFTLLYESSKIRANTSWGAALFTYVKPLDRLYFYPGAIYTTIEIIDESVSFRSGTRPFLDEDSPLLKHVSKEVMQANAGVVGKALAQLILFTQVKGVEREKHVPPEKLNKARCRAAKEKIPEYTYIRIGSYETKGGSTVQYDERRSPILHIRRGHHRNQHYGKGRAETKNIWINPTLVNFDPNRPDLKPAVPIYIRKEPPQPSVTK